MKWFVKDDEKDWITVSPDWPMAFAWHLKACDESDLTGYVGSCCGDVLDENNAYCGEYALSPGLSQKLYRWMMRWQTFDERMIAGDEGYIPDKDEEYAIDMQGVEMAKLIKEIVGEKYRVRYCRCYGSDEDGYPKDSVPFCGKGWIVV